MGLFSFLKNSGAKILTKKNAQKVTDEETERLQEQLFNRQKLILLKGVASNLGLGIKQLDMDYDGETVTVYGQAKSMADKEKLVLALGNVSGVASVDDRMSVAMVKKKEPETEFYTVKRGDTLGKIAKKFYGDATKYKVIFEANQPMLKDPNLIYPNQVLRIPVEIA